MCRTKGLAIFSLTLFLVAVPLALLAQGPSDSPDRPRGALFSEEGPSGQPLSLGWFALGLYVLVGLIFAGTCAHEAVHRALPPIRWFFAGLFLNAVSYLILLTRAPGDAGQFFAGIPRGLRKVPHTYYSQECPACSYHNHPAGDHCEGCGAKMDSPFESEAARWRKQRPDH